MNRKKMRVLLLMAAVVLLTGCTLRGIGFTGREQAESRAEPALTVSIPVPAGNQSLEESISPESENEKTEAAESLPESEPATTEPAIEPSVSTGAAEEKKPTGYKTSFTKMEFLRQVAATYQMAHDGGYVYGDSHGTPPCSDGYMSCDRLIARTLWDLGCTDQPAGGFVVEREEEYLTGWGFERIDDQSELRGGDIVIQSDESGRVIHSFVLVFYDPITTECIKYDCGHFTPEGADRISSEQPFYTVLADFPERQFYCGFRIPETFQ